MEKFLKNHANWLVPTIVVIVIALISCLAQTLKEIQNDIVIIKVQVAKIEGVISQDKTTKKEIAKCVNGR